MAAVGVSVWQFETLMVIGIFASLLPGAHLVYLCPELVPTSEAVCEPTMAGSESWLRVVSH